MVAQQQLMQVREQKKEADARSSTEKAEKKLPNNAESLEKVKDLVCLLPTQMAGEFGQCLALLESMLVQANQAAAAARIHEVPDTDSELASEPPPETPIAAKHTMEHLHIPLFPGGTERLHSEEECRRAVGDPYGGAAASSGCNTPPRGRCRSVAPQRSPGTRSRTPESQSRRQDAIHFCRVEEVAAPFRG